MMSASFTYASHLGGYTLSLINIKDSVNAPTDNYRLLLRMYYTSSFPPSQTVSFKLYSNNGNILVQTVNISLTNTSFNNHPASNCLPYDSSTIWRIITYQSLPIDLSSLNDSLGYYFSYNEDCCANGTVNYDQNTTQFLMRLEIPPIGNISLYRYNSSPIFSIPPRINYCLGVPTTQNWSATDADGDRIAYSFMQMETGPEVKPFSLANFASTSYNTNNSILGPLPVSIDPDFGYLSFCPGFIGGHYVYIKAEEFRGIKKIGEVVRAVYIYVNGNCVSTTDLNPIISVNSNSNISLKKDTVFIGSSKAYDLLIKDNGVVYDSLSLSIINGVGPNSWENLDTNSYKWQVVDSLGNVLGSFTNNLKYKAHKTIRLKLSIHPSVSVQIANEFRFKLIANDNSCYLGRRDTVGFEITFARVDSVLGQGIIKTYGSNDNAKFNVVLSNKFGFNYKWQTDFGNGFKDIPNNPKYKGVNSDTLTIVNVKARNDNQKFRCIVNGFYNKDTSGVYTLSIVDSCVNFLLDTTFVTVNDTIYKVNIDTIYTSRADTISFEFKNNSAAPNNYSAMSITHGSNGKVLKFTFQELSKLVGYKIELVDINGTSLYLHLINSLAIDYQIPNNLPKGLYVVKILDPQNNLTSTKKIILY